MFYLEDKDCRGYNIVEDIRLQRISDTLEVVFSDGGNAIQSRSTATTVCKVDSTGEKDVKVDGNGVVSAMNHVASHGLAVQCSACG